MSLPITDCQDYDLVIGDTKGHRLYTVQVKSTSQKQKDGSYKVTLKNGGRRQDDNTWSPAKDFNDNKVDYVCVVTAEHECYLIPRSSLTQKSGFRLNERFESFKL